MNKIKPEPVITVFMAAYNAAAYIKEAIESVITQTFEDYELLIVDDGSVDNTFEIISSFNDPRIRVIRNGKNMGLTSTRNVALNEAKGTYLAILDSDDIAMKNRLQLQYDFFSENPQFALCGSQAFIIDNSGNQKDEKLVVPTDPDKLKITMLFSNSYVNSSVMMKTAVLRELGGYKDYAPAEDYELFTRIAEKYPIKNLPEFLVKYRQHEHNISTVQSAIGAEKVRQIKKNQLLAIGLEPDSTSIATMMSLLMWQYEKTTFADYLNLFTNLKAANRRLKKYRPDLFERLLFDRWFEVIYQKKAKMNALSLLFNKNLFNWSYVSARQLRKTFKLSLKGMGSISK